MRQFSEAADRNKAFIGDVLDPYLRQSVRVLEIAGGTGQHAVYMSQRRPDIDWQSTDPQRESLESIEAYRLELGLKNMRPALALDICGDLPEEITAPYAVLVNINMIHISPWAACLALLEKSEMLLAPKGILYMYGPYIQKGEDLAPSNRAFDQSLRSRNPEWGIRDLEIVKAEAKKRNLNFLKIVPMPANNLSVLFQKS